ncbi:hypothetical protein ACFVH6_16560 [Spirillospora sp. NPDC127200]
MSAVTPSVEFRVANARVTGVSAVVPAKAHPGVWWTLGAVGGKARLFALGRDGRVQAVFGVGGVPAGRRWDSLAITKDASGSASLLLGSLAEGRRGRLSLYQVSEPTTLRSRMLPAREHKVMYPDGGHDAGTLLADPRKGQVYIVTRSARTAVVFALPGVLGPGVNEMTRVRTLGFGVRSGAFAPDGRLFLRTLTDLRVLDGSLGGAAEEIRVSGGGDVVGIEADGRRAVLVDRGARPAFRSFSLPRPKEWDSPEETADVQLPAPSWDSRLPGGVLGTGALGGLVLMGVVLGVAALLRERPSGHRRQAPPPRPRPRRLGHRA